MKGYVYSIITTMIEFDPIDLPQEADLNAEFSRSKCLKRLAATHNGQGIAPDDLNMMLEIRRKIDAGMRNGGKQVILERSEADFLKARLSNYRFTVPHAELAQWCEEIKNPKEIDVELNPKEIS